MNQLDLLLKTNPAVENVPIDVIGGRPTLMRAIHLAMKVSNLEDKQVYGELGLGAGVFSRIRKGTTWLPQDERFTRFFDAIHNDIPLIWLAEKRSCDWSHHSQAQIKFIARKRALTAGDGRSRSSSQACFRAHMSDADHNIYIRVLPNTSPIYLNPSGYFPECRLRNSPTGKQPVKLHTYCYLNFALAASGSVCLALLDQHWVIIVAFGICADFLLAAAITLNLQYLKDVARLLTEVTP